MPVDRPVDSAPGLPEAARLRGRPRHDGPLRDRRHERDDAAASRGRSSSRGRSGEYIAVVDENESGTTLYPPVDLDSPEVLARGRAAAVRRQPAVPASRWSTRSRCARSGTSSARSAGSCTGRRQATPRSRPTARSSTLYPHFMEVTERVLRRPRAASASATSRAAPTRRFPARSSSPASRRTSSRTSSPTPLLMGMNIEFDIGANPDVAALHEGLRRPDRALPALLGERRPPRADRRRSEGISRSAASSGPSRCSSARQSGSRTGSETRSASPTPKGTWQPRRPDPKLYETEVEAARARRPARRRRLRGVQEDLRVARGRPAADRDARHRRPARRATCTRISSTASRRRRPSPPATCSTCACARSTTCRRSRPPSATSCARSSRPTHDLVPNDHRRYRVAFVDAFRSYGIGPAGVGTLSVDTLRWTAAARNERDGVVVGLRQELADAQSYWNIPRERERAVARPRSWRAGSSRTA